MGTRPTGKRRFSRMTFRRGPARGQVRGATLARWSGSGGYAGRGCRTPSTVSDTHRHPRAHEPVGPIGQNTPARPPIASRLAGPDTGTALAPPLACSTSLPAASPAPSSSARGPKLAPSGTASSRLGRPPRSCSCPTTSTWSREPSTAAPGTERSLATPAGATRPARRRARWPGPSPRTGTRWGSRSGRSDGPSLALRTSTHGSPGIHPWRWREYRTD